MKILDISIHNIASIEGPYTIDFEKEPLKSVGLFALTGTTGSGKSTILDAICLALYNNTPRLAPLKVGVPEVADGKNSLTIKDVRTLLRKGAVSGFAKTTFTGIDNKIYRAEWFVRRARNRREGAIQSEELSLYNITDNIAFNESRKTLVLAEIRRLIGLSFEQFTKAVILAQGEFTSFLKADDTNRSEILEKLTGTDIYKKISIHIYQKNKSFQDQVKILQAKIESVELLSLEDKSLIETNLSLKKTALDTINETIQDIKKNLDWYVIKEKMVKELSDSQREIDNLVIEKQKYSKREQLLKNVEKIQPIRNEFLELKSISYDKELLQKELLELSKSRSNLEAQIKILLEKKEFEAKAYENLVAGFQLLKPEMEQARILDIQIIELEKKYQEQTSELISKRRTLELLRSQIQTKSTEIATVESDLQKVISWQKDHPDDEKLHQHYTILNALITEVYQLSEQIDVLTIQEQKAKQSVDLYQKQLTERDNLLEGRLRNWQVIVEERDLISEQCKSLEINSFQESFQSLSQEIDLLKDRQNNISKIKEKREHIDNTLILKKQKQQEVYQKQEQLENLEPELLRADSRLEAQRILYEQAQLKHSKNVEHLRNQLKEGEECPVCGSKEHPYHSKDFAEDILSEIKEALDKTYQFSKDLRQEKTVLELALDNAKQQISEYAIYLDQLDTEYKQYIQDYTAMGTSIPENWKREEEGVHRLLEEKRILKSTLEKRWKEAVDLQKTLDEYNQKVRFFEEDIQKQKEYVSNLNQTILNLSHNLEKISVQIQSKEVSIEEKSNQAFDWMSSEDYTQVWKQDYALFSQKLHKANRFWGESVQKIESLNVKLRSISEDFNQIYKQVELIEIDETKALNSQKEVTNQLEEAKIQRSILLGAKDVQAFQSDWEYRTEQSLSVWNKTKELFQSQEVVFEKMGLEYQWKQEQYKKCYEKQEQLQAIVNDWLELSENKSEEYSLEILEDLVSYSLDWIQSQQLFFKDIEHRFTEWNAVKKDRLQQLQVHQQNEPNQAQESLLQEEEKETALAKVLQMEIQDFQNQLYLNEKEGIKHQDILTALSNIKKEGDQWARLNSLLGSSDGKRFNLFAQQYSLDVLLQYANVHLSTISKRYTLKRIPDSLSLHVVDHDMADEIRSVFSLSGGESFLVSLALALALSSISSEQLNVETIFIDEGFGTLDIETLSVAMDALERLQHQGKKVGVISHVQEMTERIPVKIHVSKQGAGRSSLEILSF